MSHTRLPHISPFSPGPQGSLPLPSPSLSPSINSLLNSSAPHQPLGDPNDYFGTSSSAPSGSSSARPDPSSYFADDSSAPQRTLSPLSAAGAGDRRAQQQQQRRSPSSGPTAFSHLLQPDQPSFRSSPDPEEEEPNGLSGSRGSKRPRTASSEEGEQSTRSSSQAPPPAAQPPTITHNDSEQSEPDGQMMAPPQRRPSSATAPPARPLPSPSPAPQGSEHSNSRERIRPDPHAIEPSIFNVEPIDEFTREVADWLWGFCSTLDPAEVEIEAKIGVLLERDRDVRCQMPVPTECILMDASGLKFESNMTVRQHSAFNKLLNSRVEQSASPDYPHHPVRYSHTRETDTFHVGSAQVGGGKVRVTRDQKTGAVLRTVKKERIADMNIYSPKRRFDWRISVSTEQKVPKPTSNATGAPRHKDRISYAHQLFTVDLTQVHTPPSKNPPTHELEIEFKDARVLLAEGRKDAEGIQENRYLEMVQAFLNNVRMLIRNSSDP